MTRRKKKQKKKTLPIVQIIFILLLLVIGYFKYLGVNNVDELKVWISKDKALAKMLGISTKDQLKEAEKVSQGVLKKLNAKEKSIKELEALSQEFSTMYNSRNWGAVYTMMVSEEKSKTDPQEFIEAQNLKYVKWGDPELNKKVDDQLKAIINLKYEGLQLTSDTTAEVKFSFRTIDLDKAIPKVEQIADYDKLDAKEVELQTGELFLNKLSNNEIPHINKEVTYSFKKEVNAWAIEFLKGFKEVTE